MDDWKKRAIERKDFRHTKGDPEIPKHKKKGWKGKKPFLIEWKTTRESGFLIDRWKDWSVYKRYKRAGDRDKAFDTLKHNGYNWFEYRKRDEE